MLEAAARAIKASGIGKLPSSEKLQAEVDELTTRKTVLQAEYQKVQKGEREYYPLRQNADMLPAVPREQDKERERGSTLE